jgi:hypothetical protein
MCDKATPYLKLHHPSVHHHAAGAQRHRLVNLPGKIPIQEPGAAERHGAPPDPRTGGSAILK